MHRHLIAVEVGIERGAYQRMQLNRLAFDQHRLESLNPQPMQRWRAIEQNRMLADHFFQNVPDDRLMAVDHLLCCLDRCGEAHQLQLVEDEWLEQFERHQLRQPALMQLQLRPDHNDRTARVPEAAALALDHVGERLQRPLVGAGHCLAAASVVEQRIDRLLQHPLLIADDDLGRLEFKQALQAIVAINYAPVQVVQIGGREAAAIERHQRPQLRRQHWQHLHDHELGPDARTLKAFQRLQALGIFLDLGFRSGLRELLAQRLDLLVDVDRAQQFADRFGAHQRPEFIAILFGLGDEIVLGHQLAALQRREARIDHAIRFEIKHALDIAQRHVEHHAHARRQAL